MREGAWRGILARYGQRVVVYPQKNTAGVPLHAFVQPMTKGAAPQAIPTPLGVRREDCFLYLGPPETPLEEGESRVAWQGRDYGVQSAHLVGAMGAEHCWAVLRPLEQEAV